MTLISYCYRSGRVLTIRIFKRSGCSAPRNSEGSKSRGYHKVGRNEVQMNAEGNYSIV